MKTINRFSALTCFLLLLMIKPVFSQNTAYTVKGQVSDAQTKELLIGATVQLNGTSTRTQLDGSFSFKNVRPGIYKMVIHYVGYGDRDTTINVTGNTSLNFYATNTAALEQVVVHGRRGAETDAFARNTEKNAVGIMNVVSANTILQSPDITIGNVLQRVSGVSLERSGSGEGRYAIIRGMDQRYNYTLVNGIKIPSPDSKFRYVPMDLFPADLVERVEVNKSLTADMEGDAIGGSVNMVMKNAPNNGLYFKASASAGLSQNLLNNGYDKFSTSAIQQQSPYQKNGPSYIAQPSDFTRDNYNYTHVSAPVNTIATVALGNRFLDNKLGVIVGASYQNLYKGYNSFFIPEQATNTDGTYSVKHLNMRRYSSHLTRTGVNMKLDYAINPNHTISWYNLYVNLKEAQTRLTTDSVLTAPRTSMGNGEIWYYGRSKYQVQSIYSSTLQGTDKLGGGLSLDWSAVYSKATNRLPDYGEYEYDGGLYNGVTAANVIQNFDRAWWRNSDRDIAGYLNLHYAGTFGSTPYTLSLGGLYRDKKRDNYYDDYVLKPNPVNGQQQTWNGINNFDWFVSNPQGSYSDANNYSAYEKIKAAYAMIKLRSGDLESVAGVRMENTNQGYTSQLSVYQAGRNADFNYTDFLPSVSLKYLLTGNTNLRLAYYAAVNRPGFFEVVPYSLNGDDFVEEGNYNLKHATAQNVDLRYEVYSRANGQFMIGGFYKSIHNAIENGFEYTGTGNNFVYKPQNFGDASNYGAEVVFEKYIGSWGIRGNYTYTHSTITSSKIKADATNASKTADETRPMQGQSKHLANAALIYKNTKTGTDIQFNWQFTGKRIALVSPYYGMDYWQKDMHMFDLSAEQKVARRFYVFTKIQNLFNAKYETYINKQPSNVSVIPFQNASGGKLISQSSQYGQTYQLGVRFDINAR